MINFEWKGVMPAVTTKFKAGASPSGDKVLDRDMTLDSEMFKTNIRAQVAAGVEGIVLGGSLGEASTLREEEKQQLIRDTREVVGANFPIVMTIAEQSTRDAVRMAQQAQEGGADGLMVLPPMRYKSTDRETLVYLQEIAKATDLQVMIYNNPVDYKIEVTVPMFEELLKLPNVGAVKESTRNIMNIGRLRNAFGNDLKILTGVDPLALESLLLGADGWVAGLVCAFPQETVVIYKLAKAGRVDEAVEIYR